ncbi:MAG: hypothetical protein UX85_C0001G0065 [Candidatus Beckwithbacteria bacterium GW2011_GWB1_47_15]|uniref:Fimbrial assembly family protein n=1 Tax=Candidatus Beckwithbacteria bacterium GW2011_GWB1_47_15 TaxID=1618371 RepID=A0A0G1RXK5_9BACT|nr:MAG: hypothetical protein UY43_C0001G1063 [Candidatus Beckwithbacteria bacterium GW2011_GWC1_49_16]AQS30700.1 hypothetical protein [uncultured bacterium]KKU35887.1 MAG: hypothetical protein UX50_C0001G0064 [Candidatus Beckwithbacteria bacterium GW2011_GWA1_46_30]KKU61851.1 MAG: hypothetical protein UX85_C0001G0065 [Candidatus Beckwithbacteria bacterium GW2011_GWB1_47_15]KKU72595.1 MAG: hypothetical protein UX97_C0001G0465 [Candidatus Beckwithbacteria bacterium GW2011_GWA2_47_25]KKW04238.1 M
MTAARKLTEINLLPKERWETGVLGKLLKWALNIGRYVVVFTELVVIGAFLYRFGLDRQLTDLKEEIGQKQALVESFGDFEAKFRDLQEKLKIVKEIEGGQVKADQVLDGVSQITPLDTVYDSILIDEEGVTLEGQTLSEVGLATLLAKAQGSQLFEGVALESVSSATDNQGAIEFRLKLNYETNN